MNSATYTTGQARQSIKEVLDRAARLEVPVISRDGTEFAVTEKAGLRTFLERTVDIHPRVVSEDGAYAVIVDDLPFAAEGSSIEEALALLIDDLRDYARTWKVDYSYAPNHADNWGLVTLVSLLEDDELKAWLTR